MVRLVRYQVLGPIRASTDRGVVELGGPKQRLVLALLLADANRAVAEDRLVDGVWGEEAPAGARHTLQTYVSELRRILDDEILREGRGYRLVVDPEAVDVHRFESLVEAARARLSDAPAGAAELLREALALWSGDPYADLGDAPGMLPEISRLQQSRLGAVEDRVQADLDSGRHVELVAELEALTREHPFRERLCELHMLSLYRSGRQADALRAFDRTRELLAEELGIDPSPELQTLHRRILAQDAELVPARAPAELPDPMPDGAPEGPVGFHVVRGFELRERVGGGDFGTAYRAYQASVGREVSIKVVRPEYSNAASFVRGFEPRTRRLAELTHPNVLPLLDSWRDPKGAYLVTPWVPGGSVRRALRHGPWSLPATLRMIEQVGAALSSAHRRGVVHGDVKASNVLLDDEGNALLTDFAVATRAVDAAGAPQTAAPASISPEERAGRPLSPASDVYALGVLAVEALTGIQSPVEGPASSLTASRPDLPPGLHEVLARATEQEPSRRHERVEDLLRDLRRAAGVDVVAMLDMEEEPAGLIRNPYKGLQPFREEDALDFFGREALTDRLVEAVANHRLVAVVGPSGSGKSSVVRAGLLPALRTGAIPRSRDWLFTEMFPGSYPFEEMEAAILRIAVDRPEGLLTELMADDRGMLRAMKRIMPDDDSELVLVIDQFEELFSLTADPEVRLLFLDGLVTLAGDARGRVRVVVTLRADFFDRPLEHHAFGELVRTGLVPVTVPSPEELARAVSRPADRVGVEYEQGLVGAIVRDVAGQPGGLPLLQHALTELFARRDGRSLTADGYRATGGVLGALGRRAEELYRSLSTLARVVAQQIFLRLVSVDEQTEDARRRVSRRELAALGADPKAVELVIRQFGAHRLLSFDHDPVTRGPTVEVAHEALFREWSSLRRWIDQRREDLLLRRRLAAAIAEWRDVGRMDDYLPAGGRLEELERWAATTELALTDEERGFLSDGRAQEDRRTARRRRRRRGVLAGSVAASIVALTLAVFALVQRNQAATERSAAEQQATVADARRLATQALAEERLDRSLLLALAAVRLDDSIESRRALLGSLVRSPEAIGVVEGPGQFLESIALSPDGRTLAVGSSTGLLSFFDAETRQRLGEPIPLDGKIDRSSASLAFAPDGEALAVATYGEGEEPSFLDLVDVTSRSIERSLELPPGVGPESVAFSHDGRTLAAATHEFPEGVSPFGPPPRKSILLFDAATGASVGELPLAQADLIGPTLGLAFSPEGGELMTSTDRGTTVLWDLGTSERLQTFDLGGVLDLSPDGRSAVVGLEDGTIEVIDLETGERRTLGGSGASIMSVTWAPDGTSLVGTTTDRTALAWDLESRTPAWAPPGGPRMTLRGHAGAVADAVFSPDGETLHTSGHDGLVIAWDLGGRERLGRHVDRGNGTAEYAQIFALSPAGDLLAVPRANGTIALSDTSSLEDIRKLEPNEEEAVYGLAFSPDGETLASTGGSGSVRLWDLETGSMVEELRPQPEPEGGGWWASFSPDGTMLAATVSPDPAGLSTSAIVWELATGRTLTEISLDGGAAEIDFSPDGRLLSVVTCCGDAVSEAGVWEVGSWRRVLSPDVGSLVLQTDFSPDGRTLVLGDLDGNITFWDLGSGQQEGPALTGLKEIIGIDLSPDGSMVAAADATGGVAIWSLPSRERIGTLPGIDFPAGVAFTPDNRHLVVTHITGSAFIWDLDVDSWKRHACSVAGRNLTREEWSSLLPGRPYARLCA